MIKILYSQKVIPALRHYLQNLALAICFIIFGALLLLANRSRSNEIDYMDIYFDFEYGRCPILCCIKK